MSRSEQNSLHCKDGIVAKVLAEDISVQNGQGILDHQ
jgi:hypothetical protein